MKRFFYITILGFTSGFLGLLVGLRFFQEQVYPDGPVISKESQVPSQGAGVVTEIANRPVSNFTDNRPDFVMASEVSTSSVVFITTLSEYEYRTGTMFDWFFEPRTSQQIGSGSGVIMSKDGYVVTNNHVIDGADKITVTQGKQSYSAQLVGVDPSSDIAVLKIEGNEFANIPLGNSAEVHVGEWVLAVGNPFNLTSTVTAGIVSAKGRNINLLKDKFPLESFIQTDAAINPGNSGGALVNKDGELIGINTAILSRTGSYAGYGFAVPVNIVKKVFNDIVKYGELQKAFVGADFVDIDSEIAENLSLDSFDGVIIDNIQSEGAASISKLKNGDVIKSVNGGLIKNKSEIEEYIAGLYPGDEISVEILRENQTLNKNLVLLNRDGKTGIIKRTIYRSDFLSANFEIVSKVERDLLGIESGVKVVDYDSRGYFSGFELPAGFIITAVNRRDIKTPEELDDLLSKISGRVEIYGVDEVGRKVRYPFYLR